MSLLLKRYIALSGVFLGFFLLGCAPAPSPEETQTLIEQTPSAPMVSPVVQSPGQQLPISAKTILGGQEVYLEVARTSEEQAIGLMYRDSVADDRGMLFPFDQPQLARFWMQNVRIPLDMIFIRDGVIRAIAPNVPPCSSNPCPTYGPDTLIDSVIELRGGRATELGLNVGDRVNLQNIE